MPDEIERPAGQASAQSYVAWLNYEARRRERAELAGLFFQGERNAYRQANAINAEQLRQCVTWARTEAEQ